MTPELDAASALVEVMSDLIDGAAPEAGWVLNADDPGLLRVLDRISADDASAVPVAGGASIAAHVDHLRYGLELLNRWNRGEEPFADADYSASWRRITVSETEWAARRDALRREAYAWREAIRHPRGPGDFQLTSAIASVAHLAYHLGAIRQMNPALRGPTAQD